MGTAKGLSKYGYVLNCFNAYEDKDTKANRKPMRHYNTLQLAVVHNINSSN